MMHAMSSLPTRETYEVRDSREKTSEPIYEAYRRRQLEGNVRSKLVFFLSSFLCISAVLTIGLLQYDEYFAFINDRNDYIQNTKSLCKKIDISNIDIITTPIAGFLVILYILIYKRRVFLRDKFRYRNFGIPMMVSLWNKTDRLFSAFTYGLIAFNVFGIVKGSLDGTNTLKNISSIQDPTGLLALLYKVLQMFIVGIRYYPILVAYRANTFLISITCVIYLWIDFVENIYQYGKCESISSEADDATNETTRRLPYYITYKVLSAVPLSIFSSFIIVTLTYKAAINLIDFILRYRSPSTRKILEEKSRDTIFCMIANVDDDNEIIYSKTDFDYVLRIFDRKKDDGDDESDVEYEDKDGSKSKRSSTNHELKYVSVKKTHDKFPYKILKKVYRPDPTFRFTSRFINTITVGVVALYYVFLYWTYKIAMVSSQWISYIPSSIDTGKIEINIGEFICKYVPDACLEQLADIGPIKLPLPAKIVAFLPSFRSSLMAACIVPLFGSALVCVLQVFFLIRETKDNLIEMYKGKCEFVKKASSLGKNSIASSSFHFGGYMVGYLVWGYFIIYFAVLVLALFIIVLRFFIGDAIFGQILLKIVPVVCVIIVKTALNKLATNYWFLVKDSKILALNNFRAFNVFLYFNFYFDCFMGIISAVIRLIKALILSIVMMPRLSYSFMGRHFERQDAGYSSYSGFLHMEAMHTNPIIICFCSLLYYKDLSEHIQRYKKQRRALMNGENIDANNVRVSLNKFNGRLSEGNVSLDRNTKHELVAPSEKRKLMRRNYNPRILTRWHLYLRMTLNKEIIKYRKIYMVQREKKPKVGIFEKIKNKVTGLCHRDRIEDSNHHA